MYAWRGGASMGVDADTNAGANTDISIDIKTMLEYYYIFTALSAFIIYTIFAILLAFFASLSRSNPHIALDIVSLILICLHSLYK
jgi:hypothetical protein